MELVERAVTAPWPFRAVVADACYGENATVHLGLHRLQVGCVVALTPAHAWWRPIDEPGSLQEIAAATPWYGPEQPGAWVRVVRHFRDGHTEDWWALDVIARPYGPDKTWRASVATTEPRHLPERMTWYLLTNLPAPGSARAATSPYAPAGVAEIVRLYGLRMGVEQSYKQVKQALGWAEYQVRSDLAMRRHWVLVWCAFAFCRWHLSHGAEAVPDWLAAADVLQQGAQVPGEAAGKGKKSRTNPQVTPFGVLAGSVAEGARVALSLISTS